MDSITRWLDDYGDSQARWDWDTCWGPRNGEDDGDDHFEVQESFGGASKGCIIGVTASEKAFLF